MRDGADVPQAAPTDERASGRGGGFGVALYWAYVLNGGRIVSSLVISLVLGRMLGPEAFGIIAMANVYLFFVEMLLRQGMPAALIQRPHLTSAHLDSAFWMIGGMLFAFVPVTIALSGWWARVNGVPQLREVIIGLSPVLMLKGLSVVQESRLRRRLEFRSLALRTNLAVISGGVAGLAFAAVGVGVWALVAQQLVLSAVEVLVLWRVSDWRPRMHFEAAAARELLGFSGLSGLAGIGVFLQQRVDALLIGLLLGPVAVGLYRMAARLTTTVVDAASGALQSISLPELARFGHAQEALNARVGDLLRMAAVLSMPAVGLLALVAEPLLTLLGDEWRPATAALQLLCLVAVVQVPAALSGPLLQAAGRPGVFAALTWTAALVSGGSFAVVGLRVREASIGMQASGLALAQLVALLVLVSAVVLPVLRHYVGLHSRVVLRAVGPTAAAVAVAFGTVELALRRLLGIAGHVAPMMDLVVTTAVGGAAMTGFLLLFEPDARGLLRRAWSAAVRRPNRQRRTDQGTATEPVGIL